MSKNETRLYYPGFIIFASQIISIATGLVFTLLLARNMSQQEYGVWANIFDVIGYFILLSGVFPFWTMRFVARHSLGAGKTGFIANITTSALFAAIYLFLVPLITGALNVSGTYLLMYIIASVQIVNSYLVAVLESILRATRPQAIGFGLLVEEVSKIGVAFSLVAVFGTLFLGALAGLIAGTFLQVIYYLKLTWPQLKQKAKLAYARSWLKYSVVNVYYAAGNQLAASTVILLFLYGGQAARGNFQAASTYATIIGYSVYLSYALYPMLLTKESPHEITSSLKTVLMFAIPMTAIVLSEPRALLTILNVHFAEATPVLMVMAVDALVLVVSQFYSNVLLGAERIDEQTSIPFRDLLKSKIFQVFTLPYVQAAISLPTCYFTLTVYASSSSMDSALTVVSVTLAAHTIALFVQYAITHHAMQIIVPWPSIAKFVLASGVTSLFLNLIPGTTTLLSTFAVILVGIGIYAAILLPIEKDARGIVVGVFHEIVVVFGRT